MMAVMADGRAVASKEGWSATATQATQAGAGLASRDPALVATAAAAAAAASSAAEGRVARHATTP